MSKVGRLWATEIGSAVACASPRSSMARSGRSAICDDLEGLLTNNRIFKQRNVGIAEVKLADAWGWGFSGVMVRGSGAAWDLRNAQSYECYAVCYFVIAVGHNGECYYSYLFRHD